LKAESATNYRRPRLFRLAHVRLPETLIDRATANPQLETENESFGGLERIDPTIGATSLK
jgi:hypothetical protein